MIKSIANHSAMFQLLLGLVLALIKPSVGWALTKVPALNSKLPQLSSEQALQSLAQLKKEPSSTVNLIKQVKLLWLLGRLAVGIDQKVSYFNDAISLLEPKLKSKSEEPEIVYWWVVTVSSKIQIKHDLRSLRVIRELEKTLLGVLKKYPTYNFGAADRALGRIYMEAPSFISVGNTEKARQHFVSALSISNTFPGNKVCYAWFLFKQGKLVEARRLAESVLSAKEINQYPIEAQADWIPLARQVLSLTQPQSTGSTAPQP